ncbi:MAG TPA: type I 3-dehydroquinate dehydratase, partial [Methanocorpusculum sp.]|nr:type I 3-dehydroquinate dehydratase [Methanocorpusculum sp.]
VIEFRLDLFPSVPDDFSFFRQTSPSGEIIPTIATFRGCLDAEMYERAFEAGAAYADIEGCSPLRDEFPEKTICSVHDFDAAPDSDVIVEQMRDLSESGIPKGAFAVRGISDLLSIADAAAELRKTGKPFILIGMGNAGRVTRVRADMLGSWLNYVSNGVSAAPGELTLAEALSLGKHPAVTGLLGGRDAVLRSKSPLIHAAAFRSAGIPGIYLPFAAETADMALVPRLMKAYDIDGLNVTMPHKEIVIPHLSALDESAKKAGAVNTISKELTGFNTDIAGVEAFFSGFSPEGKSVLILGAGGAARAAAVYLMDAGFAVYILNRTYEKAEALAAFCGGKAVSSADAAPACDAVVLASPVSPVPPESVLRKGMFAADMNYLHSAFLESAKEIGCRTVSGKTMLVAQAARSFHIWMKTAADSSAMNAAFGDEA